MRGKPTGETHSAYLDRITPADAGKTPQLPPICLSTWDHPRRCGENTSRLINDYQTIGSPPQVRGKLSFFIFYFSFCGITPAGAGKTHIDSTHTATLQDHPRRCGENNRGTPKKILTAGSPPQVRGKLHFISMICYNIRITPAGAGKTSSATDRGRTVEDHPRRCGENAQ